MKKLFLILVSITLITSCDVEPLDRALLNTVDNGEGDGDGDGTPSDEPLALSTYIYNVDTEVPFLGPIVVHSAYTFNSNNHVNTTVINSTFFGETFTENVSYTRDNSNNITGYRSMASGVLTNEATISYTGDNISQIVYNYVGDDDDDYTYNFAYSANTITRTIVNSTISTVFTLDSNGQVVKKESFDGNTSIKTEVIDYDGLGNCISSIVTGEDPTSITFMFDTNVNPLKDAFSDQVALSYLNDEYSDNVGTSMAQFFSTNNWIAITAPEGTVNFVIQYDGDNRITSRVGNYDLGDGVTIDQEETFSFVN
ncbi:MAG: hypothetical protein ACSHXF_06720 [Aquaticitalea sp.]